MGQSGARSDAEVSAAFVSLAVTIERIMAWIYRTGAALVTAEEPRDLLLQLADVEKQHAEQILSVYPDLLGRLKVGDGVSTWTVSRLHKTIIPKLDLHDPRSLLITVYRIERGAQDVCRRWIAQARLPKERELAEYLLDQDIQHQAAIAEHFTRLFGTAIDDEPGADEPIRWPTAELQRPF
jgi:hypothetical protein